MNAEGARRRLFAALELPEEVRASLWGWGQAAAAQLPSGLLRTVGEEALHVTLCFMGNQPAAEVGSIAGACETVSSLPAPALTLSDRRWLPRRRPRVLAAELLDRGGELAALQAHLSESLGRGGWYAGERRPFLAHVTVARVRSGRSPVQAADRLPELPGIDFTGSMVTLYASQLGPGGSRYEGLHSVALSGATGTMP